jgi:hypothetical protein
MHTHRQINEKQKEKSITYHWNPKQMSLYGDGIVFF